MKNKENKYNTENKENTEIKKNNEKNKNISHNFNSFQFKDKKYIINFYRFEKFETAIATMSEVKELKSKDK